MTNILSIKFVQRSVSVITDKAFLLRWLPALFWLMAITLGGLHTWAAVTSYSMNADGISYLDIGDAYVRGDWQAAINSVWSPLYSWILGPVMHILNPPMRWEFSVVHLVNFVIYLGTLICFEFFWRQLRRYHQAETDRAAGKTLVTLPEWAWLALGYSLFIWSSLNLINIWAVTPDMLMAAFVYLAAGLIMRIRMGVATWRTSILLGLVLGLGYLTKAVMFPLSFVFLAIGLFSFGNLRRAILQVLVALLAFLLVSVPFIAVISNAKGELTFGDAGKITYVRYVNRVPYPHWQGETPGNGTPEHPSRKIFDRPPIYEFGTPIGGTYPVSYGPTYWYKGVVARFDLGQQIARFLSSALFYFDLFFHQQGALMIGVLVLYLMSRRPRLRVTDLVQQWGLVIPALLAFGMYGLVYVESRYVGVFAVLLWADLLANVRLPDAPVSRKLAAIVSAIMVLFILANIVAFNLEGFSDLIDNRNTNQPTSQQAGPPSWPGEVAETLQRLGVQPGDKVAVIGYAFESFWARLAHVQIVAEMFDWEADPFWLGDLSFQSQVIQAFASTGAKAIVAENVPGYASLSDWHRVGNSNYYIYILAK